MAGVTWPDKGQQVGFIRQNKGAEGRGKGLWKKSERGRSMLSG